MQSFCEQSNKNDGSFTRGAPNHAVDGTFADNINFPSCWTIKLLQHIGELQDKIQQLELDLEVERQDNINTKADLTAALQIHLKVEDALVLEQQSHAVENIQVSECVQTITTLQTEIKNMNNTNCGCLNKKSSVQNLENGPLGV